MSSPNRLIHATSPYLLQHAHNPVDWYEWSEEALAKAQQEDKPLLVSIGYSSCHWCHVMERESFENEDIASLMNEFFVCVKVDREERPDIDQIYMEAVQAMGLNGGWPLNVFLTPDQKPFYGGTYFPPKQWPQLLRQIHQAFVSRRSEINESANELAQHISRSDLDRFGKTDTPEFFEKDLHQMFRKLESKFDRVWGGMDKAPKFVMPSIWLFLLRYYAWSGQESVLSMINLTLTKMSQAGLYDQVAGGFARYSVDGQWFAPHFEKMLYDNAQLLSLYSQAYGTTKSERYRAIVYETAAWLRNEMLHADGGFYSALDADSEGVEGKFYTWTYEELQGLLGPMAERFCQYYNITTEGNWEHGRNILVFNEDSAGVLSEEDLRRAHEILLQARKARVRPGLDDKILAGWNGMTVTGLTDAYRAFGDPMFLEMAERAMHFVNDNLVVQGRLQRSYKAKASVTEGFLEDYAYLIQANINLYEVTFNEAYIRQARQWTNYTLEHFYDADEGFFFFNSRYAETLIAQKKEIFDNVIPASNSVMAANLFRLGALLSDEEWQNVAKQMVKRLYSLITTEPNYMSNWGIVLLEMTRGLHEVVIMGTNSNEVRGVLQKHFIPFAVIAGGQSENDLLLLKGRLPKDDQTLIYVCVDHTCQLPVDNVEQALNQLSSIKT